MAEPVKASVRLLRRVPTAPRPSGEQPVAPPKPTTPPPVIKPDTVEVDANAGRARGEVVKDQVMVIDRNQAELRAQIKAVTTLIGKLETTQTELKASVAQKKKELAELEARGGVLENVRQKYESEIAKDEATLAALEGKLAALRAEARRLESESKQLGEKHRSTFDTATDAENYLKYLESLGGDAVPDAEKTKAEKQAKSEEAQTARGLLSQLEKDIAANKGARKDNARATGTVLKDVAATQRTITDEKEALAAAEKELADVNSKSRDLAAKTQAQLGMIEANERALRAAKSRISSINGEIDKLEAKRKALINAALDANNKDIDGILKQLDGLDKDAARLRKELLGAQGDMEEAIAHREILEAGKKALESDMAELQARLAKLMRDKNIAQSDLSGASKDLASAKADIGTMNQKDQLLVRHGNGLSDERYKLLEEQKALEALAQLPPEKLSEADKKRLAGRSDLSGQIDELTKRIQESNTKRAALARELEKRMADIKDATGRIDKAKVKLTEIELDITEDRKSQEITEGELRQTERDLRKAASDIDTALAEQKVIRDALAKLDAEQQLLKSKRQELEKDNAELRKLDR
ncbi:MAG: hypothetical protein FJZ01_01455 [Candidatus Sericytochromatia bacterium]|nr:hypothetical protein [Candidatus Tanganyikabacteria bacterium]